MYTCTMENERIEYESKQPGRGWMIMALGLFIGHRNYVRDTVGSMEVYDNDVEYHLRMQTILNQIKAYEGKQSALLRLTPREYGTIAFAHNYVVCLLALDEGRGWFVHHFFKTISGLITVGVEEAMEAFVKNATSFLKSEMETLRAHRLLEEPFLLASAMLTAWETKRIEKQESEKKPPKKQFPRREPKAVQKTLQVKPTIGTKMQWLTGMHLYMAFVDYLIRLEGELDYSEEINSHAEPILELITRLKPMMVMEKDDVITLTETEYRALTFALNYSVCALMTEEGEKWFFEEFYPNHCHDFIKSYYSAEEVWKEFSRFADFFFRQVPPVPVFAKIKQEVKAQIDEIFPIEE